MLLAFCDSATSNLNLTGSILVMNPYGHFPARLYGLIPFTKFLLALSFGLLVFWCVRCIAFNKQVMNVHKMILVVLGTFFIDELLKLINITHFNKYGGYSTALAFTSVLFSVITRVVARCLTMMVVMGSLLSGFVRCRLGITCSSLGNMSWKIAVAAVGYFTFSLWDSLSSTFSSSSSVSMMYLIPSALIDSFIYFSILQSLIKTIEELKEKKQTSKLEIFLKLRNLIIVMVIFSFLYNALFSYLIGKKALDTFWKYQWFFNDGIWSVFYFFILSAIVVGVGFVCACSSCGHPTSTRLLMLVMCR